MDPVSLSLVALAGQRALLLLATLPPCPRAQVGYVVEAGVDRDRWKVTTPTHTTAMGIYGVLGYYENGPKGGGPGRYPEWQTKQWNVCESRGAVEAGELAGPGEHAGVGTSRRRMGAIHGCHAATSSVGAGPFFFKLVEPLPLTFSLTLPLWLTRFHV